MLPFTVVCGLRATRTVSTTLEQVSKIGEMLYLKKWMRIDHGVSISCANWHLLLAISTRRRISRVYNRVARSGIPRAANNHFSRKEPRLMSWRSQTHANASILPVKLSARPRPGALSTNVYRAVEVYKHASIRDLGHPVTTLGGPRYSVSEPGFMPSIDRPIAI